MVTKTFRSFLSYLLLIYVTSCSVFNNKSASDSTKKAHANKSKNKCEVVVQCHYNFAGKIEMWNVEIDGVKYHKAFANDRTENDVRQDAIDDCKIGLLDAGNWQENWDKDCKK